MTLATLGYGDIAPATGWLRALAPLEAVVGFALVTAGISWTLALYPALSRQRALARETSLLAETVGAVGIPTLGDGTGAVVHSSRRASAARRRAASSPVTV